jgi:hypothetical protein
MRQGFAFFTNFSLEHSTSKGLQLNEIHQLLVCADVNLRDDSINTLNKNTEALSITC